MVPTLAIGLSTPFTPVPLNGQSENATQKVQQLAALAAEAPKVKAIKADSSLKPIQKLQQIKAVHDRTDPQARAILSPQQYQELQVIRRHELQRVIAQKRESVKVASSRNEIKNSTLHGDRPL
jgi:hypothetical protein